MAHREITGLRGIVTGASGGIGAALAQQLVQAGGRMLLVARRAERLEKIVSDLAGTDIAVIDTRSDSKVGSIDVPSGPARLAASARPQARQLLGLDRDSRVIAIGCEGVTDPTIYRKLVNRA